MFLKKKNAIFRRKLAKIVRNSDYKIGLWDLRGNSPMQEDGHWGKG
jgi:hypothetical protein